jgi:5-methylcytosine-specific restriction endonuclease McrA
MVLNCDYQPLSPTTFRRALALIRRGRAEVVEDPRYLKDRGQMRSLTFSFRLPEIIRMLRMVNFNGSKVVLKKRAVIERDEHTCQYCGVAGVAMTVDHVQPKSRGGKGTWENLVCSCKRCNTLKDDRTPAQAGLRLRRIPREPSRTQMLRVTVRGRNWIEMMSNGTFSIGEETA